MGKAANEIRLPYLQADSMTLYNLWCTKMAVTSSDIKEIFQVCDSTACKVVRYAHQWARNQGKPVYNGPQRKIVPVEDLFEIYGWDIKKLQAKVKMLQKV